ncbi:hypothetical protein [Pseudomonas azerbaijanoccidentalis]
MANDHPVQRLIGKYPRIFQDHYAVWPGVRWMGIDCGEGWFPLIERLCQEIQQRTEDSPMSPVFISHMKEKFGVLRITFQGGNISITALVAMAESESSEVCEACGAPGNLVRTRHGWIKTLCTTCTRQESVNFWSTQPSDPKNE